MSNLVKLDNYLIGHELTCLDTFCYSYLAPEYFMYGKVNDKIDVFAFGVVLLELLSGRKPISSESPKGQESLVMWVRSLSLSFYFLFLLARRFSFSFVLNG